MEILSIAKRKEINLYAIRGDWKLDDSIQSRMMGIVFSMAAKIEREFISLRTKEVLAAKKAMGIKLGRPKGTGKSKLDGFRAEIEAFIAQHKNESAL